MLRIRRALLDTRPEREDHMTVAEVHEIAQAFHDGVADQDLHQGTRSVGKDKGKSIGRMERQRLGQKNVEAPVA